jgi:hypothetical protein
MLSDTFPSLSKMLRGISGAILLNADAFVLSKVMAVAPRGLTDRT